MERKKRIIICANTSWNLLNFRSSLIISLIKNGYEVIGLTPKDEYSSKLKNIGCKHIALHMDNRGKSPTRDAILLVKFLLIMAKYRPEFYLSYTIKPNIYGSFAANLLNLKTINNIAGLGTIFESSDWLAQMVKFLYRLSLRHSNCVFFQNEDDLELFKGAGLVSEKQAQLLPGSGVNLTFFKPFLEKKTIYEDDQDAATFIMVARLLWSKGVAEYVEAARRVKNRFPNASFQLLGFIEQRSKNAVDEKTLTSWNTKRYINYLGSTDDVRPHVLDADCVVLPSYYMEGTPKSLLEAAAMGKPIITTDWVGCRNVVEHGVNGYLCQPKNVDDLEAKMVDMIKIGFRARCNMGKKSRIKAEQKFDEKFVIDAYVGKINELV